MFWKRRLKRIDKYLWINKHRISSVLIDASGNEEVTVLIKLDSVLHTLTVENMGKAEKLIKKLS